MKTYRKLKIPSLSGKVVFVDDKIINGEELVFGSHIHKEVVKYLEEGNVGRPVKIPTVGITYSSRTVINAGMHNVEFVINGKIKKVKRLYFINKYCKNDI